MDIFKRNFHNDYKNPYRHGVLIGNHVEDIFGDDLKKKQENKAPVTKFSSESMDQYKWPELKEIHFKDAGNHLTKNYNSNFDLNIDLTSKNVEDYSKLHNKNFFELEDKNSFLPDQHTAEIQTKKMCERLTGFENSKDILQETQKKLRTFHQNDTRNLLNNSKYGLVENLFFGHGLNQNNFTKNEYMSTYK